MDIRTIELKVRRLLNTATLIILPLIEEKISDDHNILRFALILNNIYYGFMHLQLCICIFLKFLDFEFVVRQFIYLHFFRVVILYFVYLVTCSPDTLAPVVMDLHLCTVRNTQASSHRLALSVNIIQ